MKKIVFSILSMLLAVSIFAQNSAAPKVRKAADEMIEVYNLDEEQAIVAVEIQERRFRNLAEIESLASTDKDMYRHKYKAIQQSTDASLRRILNEAQMSIYNERKLEIRNKVAAKTAELKEQGMSVTEIEDALLEMEKN